MAQAQTVQKTTDEISGLRDKLAASPALQAQMLKNPYKTLISMGVPESVVSKSLAPPSAAMASSSSNGGLSVQSHWWGFQIILDNSLTQLLVGGTETAGALAPLISLAQPELEPVAVIIAAALCGMGAVIGTVNKGNGVHFDVDWAEILAPPLLAAALIPYPNK